MHEYREALYRMRRGERDRQMARDGVMGRPKLARLRSVAEQEGWLDAREEVLDANLFNALADVQKIADDWLADYNEYRPHESLGNVPPMQFMPRVFKPEVSATGLSA